MSVDAMCRTLCVAKSVTFGSDVPEELYPAELVSLQGQVSRIQCRESSRHVHDWDVDARPITSMEKEIVKMKSQYGWFL